MHICDPGTVDLGGPTAGCPATICIHHTEGDFTGNAPASPAGNPGGARSGTGSGGQVAEAAALRHQPDRCSYLCLGCERPWPCDPAREHLATTLGHDPAQLHTWMWAELENAAMGPLGHEPVTLLVDRFLRWIPMPARADNRKAGRSGPYPGGIPMDTDKLALVAARVADVLATYEVAIVEDEKLDGLAAMLHAYLIAAAPEPVTPGGP
jgi:hypothetical protein